MTTILRLRRLLKVQFNIKMINTFKVKGMPGEFKHLDARQLLVFSEHENHFHVPRMRPKKPFHEVNQLTYIKP